MSSISGRIGVDRRRPRAAATAPRSCRRARGPTPGATSAPSAGGSAPRRRGSRSSARATAADAFQLARDVVLEPSGRWSRGRGRSSQLLLLDHRHDGRLGAVQDVVRRAAARDRRSGRRTRRPARAARRREPSAGRPANTVGAARARSGSAKPCRAAASQESATGARPRHGPRRARRSSRRVGERRRPGRPASRVGERVEVAHLEPAAGPHRREQRGEVVVEVVLGRRGEPQPVSGTQRRR